MDSRTLSRLLESQSTRLQVLKINRYNHMVEEPSVVPKGLQSLTLKSIDEVESLYWVSWVILDNQDTLRRLCLGAEPNAVRWYYDSDGYSRQDYASLEHDVSFLNDPDAANSYLLDLETCRLISVDASQVIRSGFSFYNPACLTALSLESCWGVENAFNILAAETGLRLQSFYLRHEFCDVRFQAQIIDFLCSIPGLTNLSILLETYYPPVGFHRVLKRHGKTLQSLVWDVRAVKRDEFNSHHTITGLLCRQVVEVARQCTQLVELGISLDWDLFETVALWSGARVRDPPNL